MWKVEWFDYYWNVITLVVSDIDYQNCIVNCPDYYISAKRI